MIVPTTLNVSLLARRHTGIVFELEHTSGLARGGCAMSYRQVYTSGEPAIQMHVIMQDDHFELSGLCHDPGVTINETFARYEEARAAAFQWLTDAQTTVLQWVYEDIEIKRRQMERVTERMGYDFQSPLVQRSSRKLDRVLLNWEQLRYFRHSHQVVSST